MQSYQARQFPPSPFQSPERENSETRYRRVVNQIARRFIYNEQELKPTAIEDAIRVMMSDRAIQDQELKHRELEAVKHLLLGIAAHEKTNGYQHGAWQDHLSIPLTRKEVAERFEHFPEKKTMLFYEDQAIKHYTRLLEIHPEADIQLTENIRIQHTDIEVLINDIRARILERIVDDGERRTALQDLDRELVEIIRRVPDDQTGKRFELEEIYLLRRLIHNADNGHVASVSHGTPREDLRADHGSVDVIIAAEGDVFEFQLKTFKSGTHQAAREKQAEVHARAQRNLRGTRTHVVVLRAEAVQEAFEASLRQGNARHTLADKYAALEPITRNLRPDERARLLSVMGLTEAELEAERRKFEERQAAMTAHGEALRRKREEERLAAAEREAQTKAMQDAATRAEQERLEKIARQQQEALEASIRKAAEDAAAAKAREAAREAKRAEAARERQALEEVRAAEETLRRKKEERERKKAEAPDWPPAKIEGLDQAPLLKHLGFLSSDWKNDVPALFAAKKKFAERFAPKGKPNALFKQAFPTRDSIRTPNDEDLLRWKELGMYQEAA